MARVVRRNEVFGRVLNANDVPAIRALLQSLVHGYRPENAVVDWIHMAKNPTTSIDKGCPEFTQVAAQHTQMSHLEPMDN